jgi:hypothetical protein
MIFSKKRNTSVHEIPTQWVQCKGVIARNDFFCTVGFEPTTSKRMTKNLYFFHRFCCQHTYYA